jgi:hypothetical protein
VSAFEAFHTPPPASVQEEGKAGAEDAAKQLASARHVSCAAASALATAIEEAEDLALVAAHSSTNSIHTHVQCISALQATLLDMLASAADAVALHAVAGNMTEAAKNTCTRALETSDKKDEEEIVAGRLERLQAVLRFRERAVEITRAAAAAQTRCFVAAEEKTALRRQIREGKATRASASRQAAEVRHHSPPHTLFAASGPYCCAAPGNDCDVTLRTGSEQKVAFYAVGELLLSAGKGRPQH